MPTPSSNPTPDPSPPVPYNFSTCPEDTQHTNTAPRTVRNETLSQENSRESSPESGNNRHTQSQQPRLSSNLDGPGVANDPSQNNTLTVEISLPISHTSAVGLPSPAPSGSGSEVLNGRDSMAVRTTGDCKQPPETTQELKPLLLTREIELLQMSPLTDETYIASDGPEFSTRRAIPISPSSFLRPGSKFHGSQQSERQVYDVQVEIKFVDLRESFLCGYLRIQGLTEDHPTLTTYFEGEIIGSKYSFFTQHDDWGANPTVDLNHWGKFSAFRQFYKYASRSPMSMHDVAQKENIFMRWKEHFLVPDHRVRTITGASFEGFYYICFNQLKGEVSGIYFHSKSEKFQQLELRHVPDKGCFNAMELR